MSYEKIKSVTFDEKSKTVRVCSASNNVTPACYDPWFPIEEGYGYEEWKRMFVGSVFGGMSKFLPSCKSKAKKAYDAVNAGFGIPNGMEPWVFGQRKFPYDMRFNPETREFEYDERMKAGYDEFCSEWESAYMDELNRRIGS